MFIPKEESEMLTEFSRSKAKWTIRINNSIETFVGFCVVVAVLPAILKPLLVLKSLVPGDMRVTWVWSVGKALGCTQWEMVFAWGTFWLALSIVTGGCVPLWEYLRPSTEHARLIVRAGSVARYDPFENPRPPDKALFDTYLAKSVPEAKTGFLVPDVPVWFLIKPQQPFDVKIRGGGNSLSHEFLSSEAAKLGLDWTGFTGWRIEQRRREYYAWLNLRGIRCTSLKPSADRTSYELVGAECKYSDYVVTDTAVNLTAEGRLPDMRRLLEGPTWDTNNLDLSNISDAAKRYSMLVNVTVLMTTKDKYLVLQRRSNRIAEGAGGLNATAGGFSQRPGDLRGLRRWTNPFSSLRSEALRELQEETGILPEMLIQDSEGLTKPFLGAAFNLLHGRDLAFYAHFHSRCSHFDVAQCRGTADSAWEIASLAFVPLSPLSAARKRSRKSGVA